MVITARGIVVLLVIALAAISGPSVDLDDIGPPAQQPGTAPGRLDQYGDPLPDFAKARVGTVRFRHSANVFGVAYSPDGKTLASAGWDGVFLWDQGTGRLLNKWEGRPGFQQVAFSSDGQRIWLQSTNNGAVFVWDHSTKPAKEPRATFRAKDNEGRAFAVSPTGNIIALGCAKGVRLWDGDKETEVLVLEGALSDDGVVFSQDGKLVATRGEGGAVVLWDTVSGKEIRRFKMPADKQNEIWHLGDRVGPIGFSADGSILAVIESKHVLLWETATGKERQRISLPEGVHGFGSFPDAALSLDANYVAIAIPGSIYFFDVTNGGWLGQKSELGNVYTVKFSPNGRTLASASGFWVRQWDPHSGRELCPVPEYQNPIHKVQLLPNGEKLCTVANSLRYWDAANGCQLIVPNDNFPTILNLAANGTTAVCQAKDNQLEVWDVEKSVKISEMPGPIKWPQCALSPDGKRLAVVKFVPHQAPSDNRDTYLQLWDTVSGKSKGEFKVHECSMWTVAFSPDGDKLVTLGNRDHNVRVWDFATQRMLHEFKSPEFGYFLEFTPDSKILAGAGERPAVLVRWDLATGKELPKMPGKALAEKHESGHIAIKFLRDGKTLLTSNIEGEIFAWNLATGELLQQWKARGGPMVNVLQLSDDDKTLLTHSLLGEVLLWDLEGLLKRPP